MRVVLVVQIGGHAESVIDGVTTNVETQPGEGGVSRLVVKGKDLSRADGHHRADRHAVSGHAAGGARAAGAREVRGVRRDPDGDSEHRRRPADPGRAHPQQRGTDYAYVKRLAQQCGYVFYLEPGPVPATSKAYWGPEIRVGEPQPALSVNMDALTNVEELSFNFDKESKTMPIVFFQEPISKAPIGIPIPDVSPLNPPLGLVPPLPPKISQSRRHRADVAAVGADDRPRLRRPEQRLGVRHRPARRGALRAAAEVAPARRRARRRAAVRRAVLRQERHARHQARRIQAELHAGPQRAGLDRSDGAGMSSGPFYGKYRGTVINNVDPLQDRPHPGDGARRHRAGQPSTWAMPCVPVAGINMGVFTVPPIGAGVWIEFERGDPDYPDLGRRLLGQRGRDAGARRRRCRRAGRHHAADHAEERHRHQRHAGPTGGILIQTTTGAMISVSDVGIIISNGKGAIINMTGPTTDVNLGALNVI